jgi:phosphoserine aminotransferase
VAEQAEADLRELMGVPDNYKVLFLQGGATAQFSLIPMNLLAGNPRACFLETGHWSSKAIKVAADFCQPVVSGSSKDNGYTTVPPRSSWQIDDSAAYFHYTTNETIAGVQLPEIPDVDLPLVADMSSDILSAPLDVSRFGLIFAGAQKNIGPAGLTLVIVRDDLIGKAQKGTPDVFDYAAESEAGSMLNTPPTFAWYLSGLVFRWLKAQGGVAEMGELNGRKAKRLYDAIDVSDFYSNPVDPTCRSRMNIPFTLANPELDAVFLREAEAAGLTNLKGHRSVGGMRASIYNAMPEAGVIALVDFMADFERRHG